MSFTDACSSRSLDVFHHGFLDLASVTEVIGLDFQGDDLNQLIKQADVNGDGKIDFQVMCVLCM